MDTSINFEEAVATSLRRRRTQKGWTQEQVASEAREFGLDWTRTAVHNIESGRRHLSPGEFVVLPLVYGAALADLISEEVGPYVMGGALTLDAQDVRALLKGGAGLRARLAKRARVPQLSPPDLADSPEGASDALMRAVAAGAKGSAERNAALRLGITPEEVTLTALRLWGHGLTEERERRMNEMATTLGSARAVRGHLTRRLLAELAAEIQHHEEA